MAEATDIFGQCNGAYQSYSTPSRAHQHMTTPSPREGDTGAVESHKPRPAIPE
jgi:hypothetical protein